MHYEIRGLLEENMEWLLDFAAKTVAVEPAYWNLPDELKQKIAFEAAYQRLMGFHAMWQMMEGNQAEDDHSEVITNMINRNMDGLMYAIDDYETKNKEKRNNTSDVPTYDIEINE